MNRLIAACVILFAAGCASQPADTVAAVAPESRADLQVAMTELLEQIDVLNSRIARLEAGAPLEAAGEPRRSDAVKTVEPPASPRVVAAQSRPQPSQVPATVETQQRSSNGALAAAQLAEAYRSAIVLVGKGRMVDARGAFQRVFDAEPTGELADNALFWIGETYFGAGSYVEAMRYYRRVTTEFGDQNKAPDAMYKTALAHEKTGDLALARQTLQELVKAYPYSSSADSAKRELERIKY